MKQYTSLFILLFWISQSFGQQLTQFLLPSSNTIQQLVQNAHGNSTATIRIRCKTTINDDNIPLYVVDGIPYEASAISKINPADILEIQILKEEAFFGCRPMRGVIIITTRQAYHQKFIIKDAKNMLAVSNATIEAKSVKTGKVIYFVTDDFGRFETDSLKTLDYDITISSTGYKTTQLSLKSIIQNKGEIKLEPAFIQLAELVVVGQTIRCGRKTQICYHTAKQGCKLVCTTIGIEVQKNEERKMSGIAIAESNMNVYPNPVASPGTLNILFPNIKPGLYQLRLLSVTGQLFYSFQKQITGKGETEQIHLNSKMLPGIYIVQVMDDQKKILQSSKIVVQ